MYQINVLGPLHVCMDGRVVRPRDFDGSKPREALCVLAAHAGRPVLKEALAAALWDGEPPPSWVSTLEGYVSLLRKALQPGSRARDSVILTRPGSYELDCDRVNVDLVRFDELVVHADTHFHAAPLPLLESALRLVRGDLLQGERPSEWLNRLRARHDKRFRRASVRAAELALAAGRIDDAAAYAERICESDPMCEAAWRVVIESQWRAGRRCDALRSVQQLREQLAGGLGIGPSAAVERLYVAILRDEAAAGEIMNHLPWPAA